MNSIELTSIGVHLIGRMVRIAGSAGVLLGLGAMVTGIQNFKAKLSQGERGNAHPSVEHGNLHPAGFKSFPGPSEVMQDARRPSEV